MTHQRRTGFTLMEIMIVLIILIALLAILLPGVFAMRARWLVRQAQIKIGTIQGCLQEYSLENKGYPTNEQGLYALVFIPDGVGVLPVVPQPGMQGTDPSLGGMGGGSVAAGPELLANPAANPMAMQTGAMPGMSPGVTDPMAMGSGMTPPVAGAMSDPSGMGMGGGMMSGATMTTGVWVQPVHNPQLYTQQRRRPDSTSYLRNENELLDPWGMPYRYDNSQQYYGLNQTGTSEPAIWSAGPDKTDNTDDDIKSWDPIEAQQKLALRQQQGAMGMGTGMVGATVDPMSGMSVPQNNMMQSVPGAPTNPMMQPGMQPPAGGMTAPMQPNPMNAPMAQPGMQPPAGGMTAPMQPNPMNAPMVQPGMQTPAGGGMAAPPQPNLPM